MKYFLFLIIYLSSACSTTLVYTNNPDADVYVDGFHVGSGNIVEIDKWGGNEAVK